MSRKKKVRVVVQSVPVREFNWWIPAMLATMCLGIISVAMMDSSKNDSASASMTIEKPSVAWPMIPFEPVKYGKLPSTLPVMHRFALTEKAPDDLKMSLHDSALLDARLTQLIARNTVTPTANELMELTRSKKIVYRMFKSDPDISAQFLVENGQAIISVSAQNLAKIDTPSEVMVMMSTFAHEFIHYKQWEKSNDPLERETFAIGYFSHLPASACSFVWKHEFEAYLNQCIMLNDAGIEWTSTSDPKTHFCPRVNTPKAFAQAFYFSIVATSRENVRNTCREIWWKLAGGPSS